MSHSLYYNNNPHDNQGKNPSPGQSMQQQSQEHDRMPALTTTNNTSQSGAFSISPYDSLHTHAFQLSTSAGLVSSYEQPQNSQALGMISNSQARQSVQQQQPFQIHQQQTQPQPQPQQQQIQSQQIQQHHQILSQHQQQSQQQQQSHQQQSHQQQQQSHQQQSHQQQQQSHQQQNQQQNQQQQNQQHQQQHQNQQHQNQQHQNQQQQIQQQQIQQQQNQQPQSQQQQIQQQQNHQQQQHSQQQPQSQQQQQQQSEQQQQQYQQSQHQQQQQQQQQQQIQSQQQHQQYGQHALAPGSTILISNSSVPQQNMMAATPTSLQPHQYYITGAPVQLSQQELPQYPTTYLQQWPPMVVAPTQGVYVPAPMKRPASEECEQDVSKRQKMVATDQAFYTPAPVMIPQSIAQPATLYPAPVLAAPQLPDSLISCYDMFDDDEDMNPANKPLPDFSVMTAEERRRYERNVREQQRSYKISQQIKVLKIVLTESGVAYKPNKFSILMSVADYIKQLQSRAIMLDAEHHKLVTTIRETSEMVNSGQTPSEEKVELLCYGKNVGNDAGMLFVQGLDYKAVFEQCTAGLGVAALDGRILACNTEFESLSGLSKEELLLQSIFALMQNHKDVFEAMGSMLKEPGPKARLDINGQPTSETMPEYWSGTVLQNDQSSLNMNISLTRTSKGCPKFFNCALAPPKI